MKNSREARMEMELGGLQYEIGKLGQAYEGNLKQRPKNDGSVSRIPGVGVVGRRARLGSSGREPCVTGEEGTGPACSGGHQNMRME